MTFTPKLVNGMVTHRTPAPSADVQKMGKRPCPDRNTKVAVSGLAVAALLLVIPLNVSVASAQEGILLETIGAVRMAQPDEIRRMNDEREASRMPSQPATSQRTGSISQLPR